eukprot:3385254-Pleurochrysis_carterae.AAC.2
MSVRHEALQNKAGGRGAGSVPAIALVRAGAQPRKDAGWLHPAHGASRSFPTASPTCPLTRSW